MTDAPEGAPATPPPAPLPPTPAPSDERSFQPLLYAKLGVLAFVGVYLILFIVKNTRQIRIDFVFGSARVSLIFEMILLLVAGLVGGALLSGLRRRGRAKQRGKAGNAR